MEIGEGLGEPRVKEHRAPPALWVQELALGLPSGPSPELAVASDGIPGSVEPKLTQLCQAPLCTQFPLTLPIFGDPEIWNPVRGEVRCGWVPAPSQRHLAGSSLLQREPQWAACGILGPSVLSFPQESGSALWAVDGGLPTCFCTPSALNWAQASGI